MNSWTSTVVVAGLLVPEGAADFCFWEAPFAPFAGAALVFGAITMGKNVQSAERDERWWMEERNESWREKAVVTVDS